VFGFVVYAYGWTITDISLAPTQDQNRQNSMQRAMHELLSPNIFSQDTTTETANANFQKECSGQPIAQLPHEDGKPYLQLSPDCGARGDQVTIEGFGFPAGSTGHAFVVRASGEPQPLPGLTGDNSVFDMDSAGHFTAQIVVPNLRGDSGSIQQFQVQALVLVGLPYPSDTTMTVAQKMVETIFLALMATTLAVPISVFISFLAARNLMKQVRLPLGNILIGFVLLPVGWWIGNTLLGPLGNLGVNLGKGLLGGIAAPTASIVVFGAVSQFAGRISLKPNSLEARVRRIVINALLLAVVIFTLGALGGIGIALGERLTSGLLVYIGNFLGTLGELIELTIGFFGALAAALVLFSIGMGVTANWVKYAKGIESHIASGVLAAISGGLLMVGVTSIASQFVLFTLLPPAIAALLGYAAVGVVYDWLLTGGKPANAVGVGSDTRVRMLIRVAGATLTFIVTAHLLHVLQFIVAGRSAMIEFLPLAASIGVALGGIAGAPAGVHAVFPMGDVIYNTTRTILNALRSIEPLIMGIVFVIWVGIGPFAGVLALTLHSIASLGKLYSEQIESIDAGPLEAIQATGATRLQTIIYGVVPQIVPPYIAFTMYRWDINVRMSTIIGFVGGGGIGFLLYQQINLVQYRDAGVAVLAIGLVVSVLDYASASLRERVV
jgi:phosphonate ABC transporter permease subunit PhnE